MLYAVIKTSTKNRKSTCLQFQIKEEEDEVGEEEENEKKEKKMNESSQIMIASVYIYQFLQNLPGKYTYKFINNSKQSPRFSWQAFHY